MRGGARAIAHRADVSDEAQVVGLFERTVEEFGRLDVLVNNAGILHQQMRFEEMTVERWRELLEVNVVGAFLCAREAVRRMSTRHGGAGGVIVNVSSMAAALGGPDEYVDYAASKGAIDTLTIGLGKEVAADGVRVVGVRPGAIRTDHPRQRWRARSGRPGGAVRADAAWRRARGSGGDDPVAGVRRRLVHHRDVRRLLGWPLIARPEVLVLVNFSRPRVRKKFTRTVTRAGRRGRVVPR